MDDPAEPLIRRALGRRPPPRLGPAFAEEVLRRLAAGQQQAVPQGTAAARRGLAVATWLLAGVASVAVLAHVEWSSASRAVAWGLALAAVPLAYSATLWPSRFLALLALCGGPLPGGPREEPPGAGTR